MITMIQATAPVIENVQMARDTWRVRLHCPELARTIRPGQFVMLRWANGSDPLLGRPFALYDVVLEDDREPVAVDIVYLVIGKLTNLLTRLSRHDKLIIWGPLGNGFPDLKPLDHIGLVAGGIGQTPFLAYTRALLGEQGCGALPTTHTAKKVSIYYGARQADLLAGVEDFREAGAEVHVATDDGSAGYHGFVTQALLEKPLPQHLIGCGPEPMLHTLANLAEEHNIPCHVSLETPMACGIGACFSCVTKIKTNDGWDYQRVCIDGPVFDASQWEYKE